jgi:hypothetical protein
MTLDSARRSNARDKASNGGSTTPSSRRWVSALPVASKRTRLWPVQTVVFSLLVVPRSQDDCMRDRFTFFSSPRLDG